MFVLLWCCDPLLKRKTEDHSIIPNWTATVVVLGRGEAWVVELVGVEGPSRWYTHHEVEPILVTDSSSDQWWEIQ